MNDICHEVLSAFRLQISTAASRRPVPQAQRTAGHQLTTFQADMDETNSIGYFPCAWEHESNEAVR